MNSSMHLLKKEKEETINSSANFMKIEKEKMVNSSTHFKLMDKDEKVHQQLITRNFSDSLKKFELKYGRRNNVISGLSFKSSVNIFVQK